MRDSGESAANTIAAFVLGAVTGAAVAILMTPASGDEVRRQIGDRAREARDRANEAARQARERAADAARQGREFVDRQKEHITAAVERGRDAYQQARTGAAPASGGDSL
jgi:gas vesicle protein